MLNELLIEEIIKEERISPVYQPIVSLSTGEIFGYEALSRFDLQRNESDTVSTRDIFQTAYQIWSGSAVRKPWKAPGIFPMD